MKKTACFLFSLLSTLAVAETGLLADPTRPAGFMASGKETVENGGDGLRLQSVISPRGGRPMAIISGQLVGLGQRIGDARLVRLNETEAVLQGPKGTERLFLVPEVSKKSEAVKAAAMDNEKRKKP